MHLEVVRYLCWKGLILGVFVDTSYTPGPLTLAMLLSLFSGILDCLAMALYSHTATQPHSHRSTVSRHKLQLSCFKLSMRDFPYLAFLAGGLGTSTEAQQPLEPKRSARDRMMI
jgi:hypothetical protein